MKSKEKTVLITGASSGIGKATAEELLAKGYTVYGAARRLEKMEYLKEHGGIPLQMDITVEQDIVNVVERISKEQGGVDVLVNNAGFGMFGAMEDCSIKDAQYQFQVNVFGLARITQLVLPSMREKRAGKIVNISSMGGKIYFPLGSWYHATKHAIEGWSDCLRFELAKFGIDVIVIEPGIIATEFGDVTIQQMKDRIKDSPYEELIQSMIKGFESTGPNIASPPSIIAKVIEKAIEAPRPKTRYVAGKYAKMMIRMRSWFGDRFFDRSLMKMMSRSTT